VWAALLNVDEATARQHWAAYDPELPGAADHQIDLDIPRCHQVTFFRQLSVLSSRYAICFTVVVSSVVVVAGWSSSIATNFALLGCYKRQRIGLLAGMYMCICVATIDIVSGLIKHAFV
jgi:hypothetical protein